MEVSPKDVQSATQTNPVNCYCHCWGGSILRYLKRWELPVLPCFATVFGLFFSSWDSELVNTMATLRKHGVILIPGVLSL